MKLRQTSFALVLMTLSIPVFAGNQIEAHEWLDRMTSAFNKMSFQGTFVYSQGSSLETMRITHIVDENGTRERLYSIDGTQREVIRDKDGIRCVLGNDNAVMEDRIISGTIFPDIPSTVLASENGQYTIQTGRIARVAGRLAKHISIKPVDEFRYGYDLWLDQFSGLLLKWVLLDSNGDPLAKLMFTNLNLGSDIDMDELISTTPKDRFVQVKSRMPGQHLLSANQPMWRPSVLPPGFKLATHTVQEKDGTNIFEHQVYSDGLASVSVYVEDRDKDSEAVQGVSKLGTANAFSVLLGLKLVTVIGEVPSITVQSIASAVVAPAGNQ